ncbi:MAG: YvcK family protein [Dehalococcoidia bacterium]|nr:YvcK family protein [Dehalococcoidia bacterium]
MKLVRFLYPGLHIKRYLALSVLGMLAIGAGLAYLFIYVYVLSGNVPHVLPNRAMEVALFLITGVGLVAAGLWGIIRALTPLWNPSVRGGNFADIILRHQHRGSGPRIVAIGGGTGLSTLLRGLKEHTSNITAVVTVSDDGGSSGRLRRDMGVLPPGDFRNCLVALADAEPLVTKLFQYRFSKGSDLEGHSFGNLFIVAMSGVTGSFEEAIYESSRVLAIRGRVLPSTIANVTLYAQMESGSMVYGESSITGSGQCVRRVFIEPAKVEAYPEAAQAIAEAQMIIIGPGSLYTSILPNLLVEGIRQAVAGSRAPKVYVCNVSTQPGETDGYSVADHVEALRQHGAGLFDRIIVNSNVAELPREWGNKVLRPPSGPLDGIQVIAADVVNPQYRLRHDPGKLADVLMTLYNTEKGKSRAPKYSTVEPTAAPGA